MTDIMTLPNIDWARPSLPGIDRVLQWTGITKRRRSAYDHYMLQLRDHMKCDADYQSQAVQHAYEFPAGSSWIVFTDVASHAAMRGQYVLEQTYHFPVEVMRDPSTSPLRVLESLVGRPLV